MYFIKQFSFVILLCVSIAQAADARTLNVVPDAMQKKEGGTYTLYQAIEKAEKGDKIVLAPGTYKANIGMRLVGTPEQPIQIMGQGDSTIIESASAESKFCLGFKGSHFIEFHNLSFRNCGDIHIVIRDSTHFTFKHISFLGGRFPVYAEGKNTHHILIDSVFWDQDPSGRIYGDIPWSETHHGKYAHFNGSLIYAKGIAGSVILRNSTIKNAFNGIRMKAVKDRLGLRNMNVEIYNNLFQNIRDNPVEPEVDATNWWIHHNKILDAHAYFSFTEVAGGDWYVFRNIGVSERILTGEHTGGKILKFEDHGPLPSGPFLVFNNSWLGPRPIATGGQSRNLQYLNNAHQFTGKIKPLKRENYHESYQIKNNVVNIDLSLDNVKKDNIYHADFTFSNNTDLRSDQSALIDSGTQIKVMDYVVKHSGKAPDIGAYEHDGVSDYPPFKFNNSVYEEHPRIVKIDRNEKNALVLWSSVELAPRKKVYASAVNKDGSVLKVELHIEGRRIIVNSLKPGALAELQLPSLLGTNGLKMLTWGIVESEFRITIDL